MTDNIGTCGALNILATVAALSGGNVALITVDTNSKSIAFAASNVLTDTGAYTVIVEAGFGTSFFTVVTSASFDYEYVDPYPCRTATITTTAFSALTVGIGSSGSRSANLWYDSISGSATI